MKIIKFEKYLLILLKYLPISLAMMFGLFFFFIVSSRVSYPYSLEWMEGGHLIQVDRLLSQQSLYEAPSIDYVPNYARNSDLAHVMSNSFGFGGHNATIVLDKYFG